MAKSIPFLEQRMGADHNAHLARGDRRQRAAPRARRLRAGEQRYGHAERLEPGVGSCASAARPAARSAPSARPARPLPARAPPLRPRHHGLAAADVALQQPQHRARCRARSRSTSASARRCAPVSVKGSAARSRRVEAGLVARAAAPDRSAARAGAASDRVVRQQLLEGEAALRRMAAGGELSEPRPARWCVQIRERIAQRRQPRGESDGRAGSRSGTLGRVHLRAALRRSARAAAPASGLRWPGRSASGSPRAAASSPSNAAVLRVHDLQAERTASHLAVAAQPRAARELLLLAGREIEEAQGE